MRTTVDLDQRLLKEVVAETGESSTSKAITRALESFLYQRAIVRLEELSGKVEIDDNWREAEELELEELSKQTQEDCE